jgi:hypothetical protein
MLPLSTKSIDNVVSSRQKDTDSFDICRNVLPVGQYPICYNVASPKVWSAITGVTGANDVSKILATEYDEAFERNHGYEDSHGGSGWFSDQQYLYRKVEDFSSHGGLVRKFVDSETHHKRLDRLYSPFPINWFLAPLVLSGYFNDYHVHHPIRKYTRFLGFLKLLIARGWQRK